MTVLIAGVTPRAIGEGILSEDTNTMQCVSSMNDHIMT